MGRRSAEEEQNHWPGFVDALSTIVMVVTFLLIILAVVIFVLSQSIARSFVENATKNSSPTADQITESDKPDTVSEEPAESLAAVKGDEKEQPEAAEIDSKPKAASTKSERKVSDIPEVDAEDFIMRSRRVVDEEERIVVDAPDISEEEQETLVTQSTSFLTLSFDRAATTISEAAIQKLDAFLSEKKAVLEGRQIAIFAFVDITTGSISQARRIAYYRALAARNALLKNGLSPTNITLEIRPSQDTESNDIVRLVVQQ